MTDEDVQLLQMKVTALTSYAMTTKGELDELREVTVKAIRILGAGVTIAFLVLGLMAVLMAVIS